MVLDDHKIPILRLVKVLMRLVQMVQTYRGAEKYNE